MTNEAKRKEEAVELLVRHVIGIIQSHEDDLSDGYGYYGGQDGVDRTARDIVDMLILYGVVKPNAPAEARCKASPPAGCSARLTSETPCTTPGCKYVFKPVRVLYGSKAFSQCRECGAFVDTPFQDTPNNNLRRGVSP